MAHKPGFPLYSRSRRYREMPLQSLAHYLNKYRIFNDYNLY